MISKRERGNHEYRLSQVVPQVILLWPRPILSQGSTSQRGCVQLLLSRSHTAPPPKLHEGNECNQLDLRKIATDRRDCGLTISPQKLAQVPRAGQPGIRGWALPGPPAQQHCLGSMKNDHQIQDQGHVLNIVKVILQFFKCVFFRRAIGIFNLGPPC